jgi:hypothetical protein
VEPTSIAAILGGAGTLIGSAVAAFAAKRTQAATKSHHDDLGAIARLEERINGRLDSIEAAVDKVLRLAVRTDVRVERLERHEQGDFTPTGRWQEHTRPGIGPDDTSE